MSGVNLDLVERTMAALLASKARAVEYRDPATGEHLCVSPTAAASPSGLLPAFLAAGEAVWRECTGSGFGLDIVRDRDALLGYRVREIGATSFTVVMLTTMEAAEQATQYGVVVVNDLSAIWSAASARFALGADRPAAASPGASP